MNWELARKVSGQFHNANRAHSWSNAMSRRHFTRTAAGAAAAGAALGAGLWTPGFVEAEERERDEKKEKPFEPVHIPGASPALGGLFHVFGPTPDGSFDPIDAEPATITNFHGVVGLAYISGTVRRTNRHTGEVRTLPMIGSDMRFMTGAFGGVDGRVHEGAFALV